MCGNHQRWADTGLSSLLVNSMFFLPLTDFNWLLFPLFGVLANSSIPNSKAKIRMASHLRKDRYPHPGLLHLPNHHRDLTTRFSLPHRHFPIYQHLTPPAHCSPTRYPNPPSPQPQCPHHAIPLNPIYKRQHSQKLVPIPPSHDSMTRNT